MSREIDERVVAMYFDNRNFESAAQQTLKTLDQLKQSLSQEGLGQGFEAIGDVSKRLRLDKVAQGATKVKQAFSSVGNVLKKAFDVTPIGRLGNAFDNFRKNYLNKMIGFDFADKLVHNIENAFQGLVIKPISAGWGQYENTMDSIKTIMSSTGESMGVVNQKLSQMTEYANQTIYSLNDMTSNLGKFTNNGVALDDATNAMIGLANATADAGQGAQQASMAMYNVSQAMGVGKMTAIDWKSLENANIATQKLKNTFIETAAAHGQLTKKMEKDAKTGEMVAKYYTKAEGKTKAMEVTAENFRETLSKGWLDKQAMTDAFLIYSGQLDVNGIMALGNYTREEAEHFYEIGQEAMKAATEVRTFSKMMDALAESVQSSWANIFTFVFGDMQEGTDLWTTLSEKLDKILNGGTERVQELLMAWRGQMRDENNNIRKIEDVYNERREALQRDYNNGFIDEKTYAERLKVLEDTLGNTELWTDYRDIAIGSFMDLVDILSDIGGAVSGAFTDAFGLNEGNIFKSITSSISEFITKIREWLGSTEDAGSRISKIRKMLTGFFSVIRVGIQVVKSIAGVAINMIMPIIQPIIDFLLTVGSWFEGKHIRNLGDIFEVISKKVSGFFNTLRSLGWKGVFDALTTMIKNFWTNLKTSVVTFLDENGLSGVVEWFTNIKDRIAAGIEAIKTWWNTSALGKFFNGLWDTIIGWFTPQKKVIDAVSGPNGVELIYGEEEIPIIKWFTDLREKLENTIKAVKEWPIWKTISDFFGGVWESVVGLFKPKKKIIDVIQNGNKREFVYGDEEIPIIAFFTGLGQKIKDAYNGFINWWTETGIGEEIGKFFSDLWDDITLLFKGGENGEPAPIVQFFTDIGQKIETAYNGFVSWWESMGIGPKIESFFTGLWNSVVGAFTPQRKIVDVVTTGNGVEAVYGEEEIPILAFFNNIGEKIRGAYNRFTEWWEKTGIGPEIVGFFSGLWTDITGMFESGENGEKAPIVQFFDNIGSWIETSYKNLESWWKEVKIGEKIGGFFTDLWNSVTGLFKQKDKYDDRGFLMNEKEDSPIVAFFKNITKWISDAFASVQEWWEKSPVADTIRRVFGEIYNTVYNAFQPGKNGEDAPIIQFFTGIYTWITSAWADVSGELKEWWNEGDNELANFFKGIWESVSGLFQTTKKLDFVTYDSTGRHEHYTTEEMPFVTFFRTLYTGIKEVWNEIVGWSGWESIGNFFSDTWTWLIGLFKGDESSIGGAEENALEMTDATKAVADALNEAAEDYNKAAGAGAKIGEGKSILESIGGFFGGLFSTLADAVSTIGHVTGASEILGILKEIIDIVVGMIGAVSDWLARLTLGEDRNKNKQSGIDWLILGISLAAIAIMEISKYMTLKRMANIADAGGVFTNLGGQILQIAGGIYLIVLAIEYLGRMPLEQLIQGGVAALLIGVAIGVILGIVNSITKNVESAKTPTTATERVLSRLITALGIVGALWIVVDRLPDIIDHLSEAKKVSGIGGDDLLKVLEGIALLIGGLMLGVSLMTRLVPGDFKAGSVLKAIAIVVAAVVMIVGAFAGMAGTVVAVLDKTGIVELTEQVEGEDGKKKLKNAERLREELKPILELVSILGEMMYNELAGLFGVKSDATKIAQGQDALSEVSKFAESFDISRISAIFSILRVIEELAATAKTLDSKQLSDFSTTIHSVEEILDNFAEIIGEAGVEHVGFTKLVDNLTSGDDLKKERFETAVESMRSLLGIFDVFGPLAQGPNSAGYNIGSIIDKFGHYAEHPEEFAKFVGGLNELIRSLYNLDDGSGLNIDGIAIVGKLYESIQMALDGVDGNLPKFDATGIVREIIDAIGAADAMMQTAIYSLITNGFSLKDYWEAQGKDVKDGAAELKAAITGVGYVPDIMETMLSMAQGGAGGFNVMMSGGSRLRTFLSNFIFGNKKGESNQTANGSVIDMSYLTTLFNDEELENWIDSLYADTEKTVDKYGEGGPMSWLSTLLGGEDGEGFNFNLGDESFKIDESTYSQFATMYDQIQTLMDNDPNCQLKLRPVLDMAFVGSELEALSALASGNMPIALNAKIDLSGGALPIDDLDIINELQMIRNELVMTRSDMSINITNLGNHLGYQLVDLGNDIARMKVYLDRNTVVGQIIRDIDSGLYNAAVTGARTGVPVYP